MKENLKITDEEIVAKVQGGDKDMYSKIITRYEDKLLRYASYLTGEDSMAQDIVQESFIKAYVNLNGFDKTKKFSSWIYRIVHNEAMSAVDKQKKTTPIYKDVDFDSGINIEEDFIKEELGMRAKKCLQQMDKIYSEPLALYYLEEKSYLEISDILRIPVGTVGTRINRAKVLMQKICRK